MRRSIFTALTAISVLGIACSDGLQSPNTEIIGPNFTHNPNNSKPHGGPQGGDLPAFEVTVSGNISGGPTEGTGDEDLEQVVVKGFQLNLSSLSFLAGTACPLSTETGTLQIVEHKANTALVLFFFTHGGIKHEYQADGTITNAGDWLPAVTNDVEDDGPSKVKAQGKDHRNGCLGEGNVNFTMQIDRI